MHAWNDERIALIRKCLEDGWSMNEIARTHGASKETIRKYFPGAGWTKAQTAELLSMVQSVRPRTQGRPKPQKRENRLGENNTRAKLNADQVREIRAASGRHQDIAEQYGVSKAQVTGIKARRSWSHLSD